MVRAAVTGNLSAVSTQLDSVFGLLIPVSVEGVPSEVLNPADAWRTPSDYESAAIKLAGMFKDNFDQLGPEIPLEIRQAGPR